MSEILKISNLNYKKNNKILINNINLTVNKPEIIGLLGENGAGKTTPVSYTHLQPTRPLF